MGRKPNSSEASFFKVLIRDDFTTRLRVPHVFVNKYGRFVGENVRLRTNWGQIWDVKIVEEDDDDDDDKCRWFCGQGWTKFVKDLEIKLGEFLIFSLHTLHTPAPASIFDVSVYGTSCCLRQISDMAQDFESPDKKQRKKKSGEQSTHPCFQFVMNENQKSRWSLPKKFVEESGLSGKRAAVLVYPPKQRYWGVILDESKRSNHRDPTLDISVGWNDFRKDNTIVTGRTYSFEFHPSTNLIQVKEVKH